MKNKIGDGIVLKKKKETDKHYAHEDVYLNGNYVGYIMKNNSEYSAVHENWNFSGSQGHKSFYARTKDELIKDIL